MVAAVGKKHERVAQALMDDIRSGKQKVGAPLPSENELAKAFGVSRHTVRVALGSLQDRGMISSQQGVGSVVLAKRPSARYSQSFDSLADLTQYASNTRVEIVDKQECVLGEELAAWLGCRPGERWWRVRTQRYSRNNGRRIAVSEIFIPYVFGSVVAQSGKTGAPIFKMIEKLYGESITEIRQEISAAIASPADAEALGLTPPQALLVLVRRYFNAKGQLLEATRSLHPAESFNYSMRVRLTATPSEA